MDALWHSPSLLYRTYVKENAQSLGIITIKETENATNRLRPKDIHGTEFFRFN